MISISKIYKSYPIQNQKISILQDCSLHIPHGQSLAIMGPSGSGKTTFLNLISGIDQPDSGTITINQQIITQMTDQKLTQFRLQNIGIIFQFFNLIPSLSTIENVALPHLISGTPYSKAIKTADHYLKLVQLSHKTSHYPSQLSGGEMQRACIARALVLKPPIVLADEPTGNLDQNNTSIIIDLILSLSQKLNHTLLLVTHDQQISQQCQKILSLKNGKLT